MTGMVLSTLPNAKVIGSKPSSATGCSQQLKPRRQALARHHTRPQGLLSTLRPCHYYSPSWKRWAGPGRVAPALNGQVSGPSPADEAGGVAEAGGGSGSSSSGGGLSADARWQLRFQQVQQHLAQHGTLPPDTTRLGGWVRAQRSAYTAAREGQPSPHRLTPEHAAALEGLARWSWEEHGP